MTLKQTLCPLINYTDIFLTNQTHQPPRLDQKKIDTKNGVKRAAAPI